MNVARYRHAAVVLSDSRVLVTGGKTTGGGVTNAAEIYAPALSSWIVIASIADARSGHTATLLKDGRVLLVGRKLCRGSLDAGDVRPGCGNIYLRGDDVVGAQGSRRGALVGWTGADCRRFEWRQRSGFTEIYDPEAGTLAVAPALSTPRAGLSATTLLNGKVLIAGGTAALTIWPLPRSSTRLTVPFHLPVTRWPQLAAVI